jgi:protein tyrosine phosphatase (PTP) superfamily phosphohydrolase (DUF442 family)
MVALLVVVGAAANDQRALQKIESKTLPNAYRVTDKVISGGQPDGEEAFAELQRLGVKTVITVDGATPDVEAARRHGLRYVHLPHGYDGIPDERIEDLAKAVSDLPGPIYIHCHHGKHRSPAAAAAACVATGDLSSAEALDLLRAAGTSPAYRGLYQSVAEAKPIPTELLVAHEVEFRESVELPPMADAMVAIERLHDHLQRVGENNWQTMGDHPDIDPPHEALLLREAFTELLRTDEAKRQPHGFVETLKRTEKDAQQLEDSLRAGKHSQKEATASFDRISNDCKDCHQKYRDVPLKEKQRDN